MIEADIEGLLRKRIKELAHELEVPMLCLKFLSPGFSGVPDRIILLYGGIVVFAETKAPGKRERPLQRYIQSVLCKLGFKVFSSVDSPERVSAVIEHCRAVIRRD